ncbi:MAG: SRPBCC domain-containing protein [Actinobacteria bacterium]|jgi:hypothetical protein|nr:MAG: SRPBCC domain-containing protein [Actinomycetota bacterium]
MPAKDFSTVIEIAAPAQRVWDVLTDFASYPQWNPMIRRASGELRVGARLKVRYQPRGSRGYTFRPKLLAVEPGRELRWLGWPRFPGIFDFEHYWIMEDKPDGRVALRHGTIISGLLAAKVAEAMERASKKPFEEMNRAHKQRAEGKLP